MWIICTWIVLSPIIRISSSLEDPGFDQFLPGERDCPSLGDSWVTVVQVPWGLPDRALLTIPPEVRLDRSPLEGAGLAIFSTTFIKKYTWLSDFEGEIVDAEEEGSEYSFESHRNAEFTHAIDAYNVSTSNWLRYINCATGCPDENVEIKECMGKVLLMTYKDIYPGQELLYWYGHSYAEQRLGMIYQECVNKQHRS